MIKTLQIDAFIVKASYVFCNSPEMLSCQQIDYLLSGSRFVKKLWCFVGAGHFKIFGVILHRNSDWLGTYSQHTKACKVDMITDISIRYWVIMWSSKSD